MSLLCIGVVKRANFVRGPGLRYDLFVGRLHTLEQFGDHFVELINDSELELFGVINELRVVCDDLTINMKLLLIIKSVDLGCCLIRKHNKVLVDVDF